MFEWYTWNSFIFLKKMTLLYIYTFFFPETFVIIMTVLHIYTKASLTLLHIHMYNDNTNIITVYICFVYTSLSILHCNKLQKM